MSSALFATWISAVGSAGAFLAFAGYVGIAMLNRRDAAERYAESQAHRVAAWLDQGQRREVAAEYVLCVHNGGDSPVFNCDTRAGLPEEEPEDARRVHLHILPPGQTAVWPLSDGKRLDDTDIFQASVPELLFTDSSGRAWRRDTDGILWRRARERDGLRKKPRTRVAHEAGHGQEAARVRRAEHRSTPSSEERVAQ